MSRSEGGWGSLDGILYFARLQAYHPWYQTIAVSVSLLLVSSRQRELHAHPIEDASLAFFIDLFTSLSFLHFVFDEYIISGSDSMSVTHYLVAHCGGK